VKIAAVIAGVIRNCLPGILIFSIILVVLGVGGEIWLRIKSGNRSSNWPAVNLPGIGHVYEPNAELIATNNVDYWVRERINSLGFPDREPIPLEKARDSFRVAFIGDSFVAAIEVDYKSKQHIVLEKKLNARLGENRVTAYAFGHSGTGQMNQLPYYDAFASKYQPHLVVLVLVANDFCNNSALLEGMRAGWNNFEAAPRLFAWRGAANESYKFLPLKANESKTSLAPPPLSPDHPMLPILTQLRRKSFLYRWLIPHINKTFKVDTTTLSGSRKLLGDPAEHYYQVLRERPETAWLYDRGETPPPMSIPRLDGEFCKPEIAPLFQEAVDATGFALDQWQERAQRDNFNLLTLFSHHLSQSCDDGSNYKKRYAELLNKRNIAYVDQCDTIKAAGGKVRDAHFQYDDHWSPQGHVWAAETVERYLLAHPALLKTAP